MTHEASTAAHQKLIMQKINKETVQAVASHKEGNHKTVTTI